MSLDHQLLRLEFSREDTERDFALTISKDRFPNKFLDANFQSHKEKVKASYGLLKLHYFKLHWFQAMV